MDSIKYFLEYFGITYENKLFDEINMYENEKSLQYNDCEWIKINNPAASTKLDPQKFHALLKNTNPLKAA